MTDKIEKLVGQAKHGLKDHNMFWSVEAIPVSLDFPAAGVKLYLNSEYSAQVDLTLDDLEALIRVVQETKKETIDDYVIPWADGLYVQQIQDHPHLCGEHPPLFCPIRRSWGSPPPVWGTRVLFLFAFVYLGITPTCVGNTKVDKRR